MGLTESVLRRKVKAGQVRHLTVTYISEGLYKVFVRVAGETDEVPLLTARGAVRTWVSLDRLARHIRMWYGDITVQLVLSDPNVRVSRSRRRAD